MAQAAVPDDSTTAAAPARPTNAQRVTSGLAQSITGPINIARGVSGLSTAVSLKALGFLFSHIRAWINPPEVDSAERITLSDEASTRSRLRHPLLIAIVVGSVLAIGAVAFKLLRTPPAPPVASEPPRVRTATGATADSAPASVHEAIDATIEDAGAATTAEEDPRKKGE